jgi:hypothetical protein
MSWLRRELLPKYQGEVEEVSAIDTTEQKLEHDIHVPSLLFPRSMAVGGA